jgi:hypothetical protein
MVHGIINSVEQKTHTVRSFRPPPLAKTQTRAAPLPVLDGRACARASSLSLALEACPRQEGAPLLQNSRIAAELRKPGPVGHGRNPFFFISRREQQAPSVYLSTARLYLLGTPRPSTPSTRKQGNGMRVQTIVPASGGRHGTARYNCGRALAEGQSGAFAQRGQRLHAAASCPRPLCRSQPGRGTSQSTEPNATN